MITLDEMIESTREYRDSLPEVIEQYRGAGQLLMVEVTEEDLKMQTAILEKLESLL